jgi:predicted  nucleic acid-binding Zn-ribbon protein
LQEEIRQLKVALHDREVTEKQLHEKMTRWQRQIQSAATAREFQALQNQLESARIQLSVLEDEMLDLIDKLERRQQELPEREQAVQTLRSELAQLEQSRAERLRLIQERLQQARVELARLEAELPQELQEVYQRLVRSKAHEALAPVEHGSCMGCFTETTLQMLQDLRLNRPVICKSCGRILYLTE